MNASDPGHAPYAELAAGYALDALDVDDEQRFVEHAATCATCRPALAEYREVTAALADLAPVVEPDPRLGRALMAAASLEPRRPAAPGPPDAAELGAPDGTAASHQAESAPPVASIRSRRLRLAAAAAAVALAAGGVSWAVIAGTGTQHPPAAACTARQHCYRVVLASAAGRPTAATVIVRGGTVTLIPAHLPADDTASQIYVLWQITGARAPLAVGSFDVRAGHHAPISIGSLPEPFGSTHAFAVSLEHGRSIPARPSRPVAVGQIAG